jgi:hypothetical protein
MDLGERAGRFRFMIRDRAGEKGFRIPAVTAAG